MTAKWIRAFPAAFILVALISVACSDDGGTLTVSSVTATAEPSEASTVVVTATATPVSGPSGTASLPSPVDPCALRMALDGRALQPGPAFALDDTGWQLCIGGAAAGSSEKYLFGTFDGGLAWKLLSMTTLGNPPAETGVGELPNGNAAEALFFTGARDGWLGLSSPGKNLFRTADGGVTWKAAPDIPAGLPVTAIAFSDANHGAVTTPRGVWTTDDGGTSWTAP